LGLSFSPGICELMPSLLFCLLLMIRVARWHMYFQTKGPILGKFRGSYSGRCEYIFWPFGLFYRHFGIFCGYFVYIFCCLLVYFSVLVCFPNNNLATLLKMKNPRKKTFHASRDLCHKLCWTNRIRATRAGLPDFSGYNIPKRENNSCKTWFDEISIEICSIFKLPNYPITQLPNYQITKFSQNIQNYLKICQITTKQTKTRKNISNYHKTYQNEKKYIKLPQNIPDYQKYTRWPQNIPDDHKIYKITTKYTKLP
jgi:hypothetical protein